MAENTTFKKIMDVLFEPDDEEGQINNVKEKVRNNEPVRYKAEDILYGKKNKEMITPEVVTPKEEVKEKINTTFINYAPNEPVISKEETVEPSIIDYEPSQNISPIFGPLDTDKKKTYESKNATIDYASTEKPNSSYLSMPMSPFYGFDTKKEDDKPKEETKEEVEEIEDFDITEDLGDIFATDEYKQETKESFTEEIDLFSDFYIDEDK